MHISICKYMYVFSYIYTCMYVYSHIYLYVHLHSSRYISRYTHIITYINTFIPIPDSFNSSTDKSKTSILVMVNSALSMFVTVGLTFILRIFKSLLNLSNRDSSARGGGTSIVTASTYVNVYSYIEIHTNTYDSYCEFI